MKTGATIFNYLDEEKKIMGISILELAISTSVFLICFVLQFLICGVVSVFASIMIIRYVKDVLKRTSFARRVFFLSSDIYNSGYGGKFYL